MQNLKVFTASILAGISLFTTTAAASESPEELFQVCAGCHGEKGEKNALSYSEKIQGWKEERVLKALKGYKDETYGGLMANVMKQEALRIKKGDEKILAKYITTLGEKVEHNGATLYKKCASCHGIKGENIALGGSKIIQGCKVEILSKKLKGYRDGEFSGLMVPVMEEQVADLTDRDIKVLSEYIHNLKK